MHLCLRFWHSLLVAQSVGWHGLNGRLGSWGNIRVLVCVSREVLLGCSWYLRKTVLFMLVLCSIVEWWARLIDRMIILVSDLASFRRVLNLLSDLILACMGLWQCGGERRFVT